jgi:lipopolysaccharide biosynthesis glycosyltransferase
MIYRVYIGWNPKEPEAAEVCRHSLLKHSTLPIQVHFLKRDDLKKSEIYRRDPAREIDDREYPYLRYFVPHLANFTGWAVYCDPGVVWNADVRELFQHLDPSAAVHIAKHDPKLTESENQYNSGVILWNCGHDSNRQLTPEVCSNQSPTFLHTFEWIQSTAIFPLALEWNWLANHYDTPKEGEPKAIHFANGGPWRSDCRHVKYGWYYARAFAEWQNSIRPVPAPGSYDYLPSDIKEHFDNVLKWRVDPDQQYYDIDLDTVTTSLKNLNNNACVAVEADTVEDSSDKLEAKGHNYDPFLKSFILGSGGQISVWDKTDKDKTPVVLRGVTKRKHMTACQEAGRDFYYIDTGYFGNGRKKTFHRITKNNMQNIGPVILNRPRDRLAATGYTARKFRPGRVVLVAPPSQKLLMCYNIELDQWLEETLTMLKLHTDREVIVRNKQSRSVRQGTDTMEMALERDVHCVVTFSSIAAVEAVLLGKPAITLGPSAAHSVTSQDIRDVEKPYIPTLDEVEEWAAHLAYCQFTELEMRDGTAWRILNETL